MVTEGWDDFDVLADYNEIVPNVFLGGVPREIDKFEYVFALNGRPTYYIPLGKMVVCRPFNDCDLLPDEEMLHELAQMVIKCASRGPTLVHCAAGINRSSLVVALALVHTGMAPIDAINLIRLKRDRACLGNKTFERWLTSLGRLPGE